MSSWPYPYCPHQAFNKNIAIRLASIPYSFVPDPTIDAFTNVNIKCANLGKHNIPSLAYQQYFTNHNECETNFAKDYYLDSKDVDKVKFDNNIVQQKKKELGEGSAYVAMQIMQVLASNATTEYQQFQQNRKNALDNARRRAVSALRTHYIQKKQDKVQSNLENGEWLKKLYRKLQQIAKHIVDGQGESLEQKEKMFLLSKGSLTANYLSQIKVKDPKIAFNILEELRILMMKKKMNFENQRQEQEKNKSVSMSCTSEVSQNVSQGSMLSEATSVNESHIDGQEEVVAKFCDFENLSKKWGVSDVQQVKYLLRVILTRKFVSDAGLNAIKKKREAERINQSLEKLNPELAKKIKADKENKQDKKKQKMSINKRAQTAKKPNPKSQSPQHKNLKSTGLTKDQQAIKEKLISGGQFDALGQKFSRNRNFSQLFAKKQEEIKVQFSVKEKGSNKTTPLSKSNKGSTALALSQ